MSSPFVIPIALFSFFLLWRLRVADLITIRISMAVVGADCCLIALAGLYGAPVLGVLIISSFAMIVGAGATGAYLLLWRRRGGLVNGHPIKW